MAQRKAAPQIGLVMGSDSDWDVMKHAAAQLDAFGIAYEARVLSAHRMPDEMFEYAEDAGPRGLRAIIAGAGGAAHLPGMLAAKTTVPILGVPVPSKYLRGEDSLLSIVQMPAGVPVATFAIGEAGAANAALFVVALLAATGPPAMRSRPALGSPCSAADSLAGCSAWRRRASAFACSCSTLRPTAPPAASRTGISPRTISIRLRL